MAPDRGPQLPESLPEGRRRARVPTHWSALPHDVVHVHAETWQRSHAPRIAEGEDAAIRADQPVPPCPGVVRVVTVPLMPKASALLLGKSLDDPGDPAIGHQPDHCYRDVDRNGGPGREERQADGHQVGDG